ncbi:minor capsid protein [Paenibacillus brasilensis]|uniref:SPP1 gp7 family putative phage head morphogenesis protein n=1 Tax=Paenibacillus brasilensis TaxID=128574 RepID=A0ABU0KWZ1_9BACL|nr:minor capsid protein [Paenibacillus brasilensis]MDQ0492758.1 SPP1 gp7 family putative phage head morphogenesis protein [Paenibacillus brasilensis]
MRSEEYWSKRMDALNEAQLSKGDAYVRKMEIEYAKANASIQRDLDTFYQRFAKNNEIGLAEARQVLKAGELKEFKWTVEDYIKAGRENAVDQRWMKELENASIRVRMTRLEALQMQMRQHVEVLTGKRQAGAKELMGDIYKDGYYHSVFELHKGTGLGATFSKLDKRQIEAVISKPWAADGSNFSSRIWKDRDKLVHELQTVLTQGMIRGDTPDKMINALSDRMGVSRSAAARIIQTESAYFAGQSRMDAYKELGVEQYKFTATLDKRTSSICRHMDGEVFALSEAEVGVNYPPLHAHCRSTTIPYYEDNVQERIARDEDGKNQAVPGDMTYSEWAKENVPATDHVTEPIKPVEPDNNAIKTVPPELENLPNRPYNPKASYHVDISNVSPAAADKIADISRELVREGSKTGKGYLSFADFDGKELTRVTGSKDSIPFTPKARDMLLSAPAGSLVLVHNHPRGNRLNVKDARSMALYAAIGAMVVAGHDGGTSTLSAPDKRNPSEFDKVLRRVTAEVDAQLQDDPAFAELSPTAKNERFDYLVLMAIVSELGWEYAEDYEAAKDGGRIRR